MDNPTVVIVLSVILVVLLVVYIAQFGLDIDLSNPLGLFGILGANQGNPEDDISQGSGGIPLQPLESKGPPGGTGSGVPLQVTRADSNETNETQETVTVNVTEGGIVDGDVQREVNPGGADRIDFVIV